MRKIQEEIKKKTKTEYPTINTDNIEFDLDEIQLRKTYEYKSFCRLAGIKTKDTINRRIVLNELKRYCIFEQIGAKHIKIYSIFKKPRKSAPIKLGEFSNQFNLSVEDAYSSGIYAVVKDCCIVIGYCKYKKCFLEQFLNLVSPTEKIQPGTPEDFIRKGGVFIPLELDGVDFNGDNETYLVRMKYVIERIKAQDEYVVFNNTPRTTPFNKGRWIKVPFSNYDKAMQLLADNKLI